MKPNSFVALWLSSLAALVLSAVEGCAPAIAAPTPTALNATAPISSPATAMPEPTQTLPPSFLRFGASEWKTNFNKSTVPLSEIISGGPPKDGIPALDDPQFISVAEADKTYSDNEPVVVYQNNRDARAYPLQILIWHEIVNDTVGGKPVTITFCPLCNTSIVFDRTVAGQVTTFGTTGRLRFSDLVMYDRTTETWWQQATGEAIIGDLAGKQLTMLSSQVIAWSDFKTRFPDGKALSQNTGYARAYGANPYAAYDNPGSVPFLYRGPATPKPLNQTDYVVTLLIEKTAIAYPYRVLAQERVVNDSVAGQALVVIWKGGTASALDAPVISQSRDIGATGVFSRQLQNRVLTFILDGDKIKDQETGSTWNIFGEAMDGALKGQTLTPMVHGNHFWFAWAAFQPETKVYGK